MPPRPHKKIALVFPRSYEYSHRITEGIAAYKADRSDLQIRDFGIVHEEDVPQHLAQWQPHGVLCFLGLRSRAALELLMDLGKPIVNLSSDFAPEGIYSVHADPESIAKLALSHFRGAGLRHAAFVGIVDRPGGTGRCRLFQERAKLTGWPEPHTHILVHEPSDDAEKASADPDFLEWVRNLPERTGILCLDDETGDALCRAAIKTGRRIPEDLAVLGVNDSGVCAFTEPSLSSMRLPAAEIGEAAATMLEELIDGRKPARRVRRIAVKNITWRGSTQAAPAVHDDMDMRRILKMIEERAARNLGVEDLVATLSCSRVTFEKRFRAATGTTPGEAIRAAKLARAENLLRQTELTSTRIAMMCGYDNLSNFCNRFRAVHGVSPQAYRKRRRG